MGRVTVHWGESGLTCMRNGDYHGAIIEADLALGIAYALPPPFLLWLVAYCTFSTPPSLSHQVKRHRVRFPDGALAIFFVCAKASLPISLSPFLFLSLSSSVFKKQNAPKIGPKERPGPALAEGNTVYVFMIMMYTLL